MDGIMRSIRVEVEKLFSIKFLLRNIQTTSLSFLYVLEDMGLSALLSTLLILLMKDSRNMREEFDVDKKSESGEARNYIDENYNISIILDSLSNYCYIDKTYLA